ncbi:MAG TPA: hypothetical protein VIJ18_11990 [Microbacteriaceae bacterium]
MRWDNLFDDLEGQLEQERDAEQLDLLAEEERLRLGRLSLRDRILSMSTVNGRPTSVNLRIQLVTQATLVLQPTTFGKDWLAADLVDSTPRAQCVLPLNAIASVSLTASQLRTSLESVATGREGRLVDRIGLPFVLRDLCRRRKNLELVTAAGSVHGTIDRVGRDHLDLAVHERGSTRHASNVTDIRMIPLERIVFVRL